MFLINAACRRRATEPNLWDLEKKIRLICSRSVFSMSPLFLLLLQIVLVLGFLGVNVFFFVVPDFCQLKDLYLGLAIGENWELVYQF